MITLSLTPGEAGILTAILLCRQDRVRAAQRGVSAKEIDCLLAKLQSADETAPSSAKTPLRPAPPFLTHADIIFITSAKLRDAANNNIALHQTA